MRLLRGEITAGRLHEVTKALAIRNGCLSGLFASANEGAMAVDRVLANGTAAERFAQSMAAMGGPVDLLSNPNHLSNAPVVRPVMAAEENWGKAVSSVDTRQLGLAVVDLGGGRTRAGQSIDHAVGCTGWMRLDSVADAEAPLAVIHARNEADYERAAHRIRNAVHFSEKAQTAAEPVVIEHRTA
jgi:thymidine phosphorylase